jgi:hypothetical protein
MPEIGFEDIQQDVKRIRETLGDLKTIHDQLNKARSVACVIINDTDSPLTFVGDHHDHGAFASGGVPVTIPPRAAAAFGSQSHGGAIATGTEASRADPSRKSRSGADGLRCRRLVRGHGVQTHLG